MTGGKTKRGRLAAAERFVALRILDARLAQVGSEQTLASEDRKKVEIEAELAALDSYRRAMAGESRLSAVHLVQAIRYRTWMTERLDAQLAATAEAQRAHDANLDRTRDCVRERSALERACRRRDEQLVVEELQQAQKLLDSQANLKLVAARPRGGRPTGGNHGD